MINAPAKVGPANPERDAVLTPRKIAFEAPWQWLADGWRDLWCKPAVSLAYGAAFAAIAAFMLFGLLALNAHSLFLPLAGGFFLIGPLLAVGLYEKSRRLAGGQPVSLTDGVAALRQVNGQLGFFGAGLLFIFLVWQQLAFLLLMLFMGDRGLPPPSSFMQTLLFTGRGLGLLIVGTVVGGFLAAIVYSISATAVPMLMRNEIDAVTAARASFANVWVNWKPMILWAGLIAMIMAAGFMCFLAGLVIAFPWIGHATWHAYAESHGDGAEKA